MPAARRLSPDTVAHRLAKRFEADGRSVQRVIIEGDRVEIVLDDGEPKRPSFDDVEFSV